MKIEIEAVADFYEDDNGCAKLAEISGEETNGVFVRIISWSDKYEHPEADHLHGKK